MDPRPEDDEPVADAPTEDEATAEMMHLLHEGVPLTLLADLASPGGPDSPEILAEEGLPDVGWLGEREPDGAAGEEDVAEEDVADA